MRSVRFERSFSAAHRIWNDDSPCSRIHGHNYRVTVHVRVGDHELSEQGFIVPFDEVKQVIDHLDHRLLIDMADPAAMMLLEDPKLGAMAFVWPPSTENLARYLAEEIRKVVEAPTAGVHVKLQENDSISASWLAE